MHSGARGAHPGDEIAMVAHDLRAPLASLVGAARMIANGKASEEDRGLLAGVIDRSATQLEMLIEELLRNAQEAVSGHGVIREPVDVSGLLGELAASCAATHGVEVSVEVDEGLRIYTDHRVLVRIVQNLVDNAVRHGEPPFTLRATGAPALASVSVTNHGPPIPPETRASLFQRFQPGSSPSSRTGLGLHIVARLVLALGATVTVDDENGATTFRVDIPQRSPV